MSELTSPSFITPCTEDENGNLVFEIPDELLEALAWKEGTVLDISILAGSLILREVRPTSSEVADEGQKETPAPRKRKSPAKRRTKTKEPVGES